MNLTWFKRIVKDWLQSFDTVKSENGPGSTSEIVINIGTSDAKPFKQKQYLMSPKMLKVLNNKLDDVFKMGVLEPYNSSWNGSVILVRLVSMDFVFIHVGCMKLTKTIVIRYLGLIEFLIFWEVSYMFQALI